MSSAKLQSLIQARFLLGNGRLEAFLRWCTQGDAERKAACPHVCGWLVEQMDHGQDLDTLFAKDAEGTRFVLKTEDLGGNTFRITFGYVAGPTCGDGAEYEVTFSETGEVLQGSVLGYWTS